MSAQDATIASLQNRLHAENSRRFEQIEKNQERQQEMLEEVLRNTASLPQLKEDIEKTNSDVEDLKAAHNRLRGGGKALGGMVAAWEVIRFVFFKH